ncbi:MAG TPA: SpoIIE family protein phosphatase, partial [Isosphaeraceae bacterium]|nr:SpoIIE family protein phosphatase [Isosphaeraceae bacterium]
MPPLLKKVTGQPTGQLIELVTEITVVGRAPECNIVLDPFGVSRKHAEIKRQGEHYYLVDLGSRNKTKLNDEEIQPQQLHMLRQGDRINICDIEFVYLSQPEPVRPDPNVLIVTDSRPDADSTLHTLDASRSDIFSGVRPEAKIRAILEISRNLSSDLNIDTVAPKILKSLFELFKQAERGFLVLEDPETKRLVPKAFEHRPLRSATARSGGLGGRDYDDEVPMSISKSLVNQVLVQKKAVLSQDAGQELPTSASIADLKIRSVMCAPLLTPDGQALGILQLDTSNRKQFSQEDLDLLVAMANQAAIFMQNAAMHATIMERERLDRDLRLAEQVQKRFLPQSTPKISGFEFFAHYNPAYEVGGDFYDFVPLPSNRLAVALGDVSGKGIAAALMMAKFSGDARYCILTETAPAPAVDALNELLCAAGIEERFITLCLCVIDLSGKTLTVCSAGHPPCLIKRADGRIEEVGEDSAGFPLGIVPMSTYQQVNVQLQEGDVVIIYSDGVTDSRSVNEELYESGENRRLKKRISEAKGGPTDVGKAILQEIREFSTG